MKKNANKVKHIPLDEIKDPKFLSSLSYKELNILSSDIRKEIIEKTSKLGGHLSSNLGVVELTIALNRIFDFSKDKIIFDVGHQCYTYKILTGRKLDSLRKKDGLSGFQKRSESPYDSYEAGHSSTSISAANGFAIARDLKNEKYNIIALIGDSSIVSGLAFEGLNNLASSNHKVIVVLNDNGMSISKPIGGLSKTLAKISSSAGYNRMKVSYKKSLIRTKLGKKILKVTTSCKNWFKRHLVPATLFDNLGLSYIGPVDGHNIKALEKAFQRAKNTTKSVVVHVCTLKGKGYHPAENDETGYWHGVTPFKIESGEPLSMHEGYNSWSHIYSDMTLDLMEKHVNAYLISPATIKGAGLDQVFSKFKDRTLDVGIAEEHAMTLASGLSIEGYHPIISIYSTFMQRAFDEISHDLARMRCNATILVDRAGLVGADGETHQGIYDVSFLMNTPNTVVAMASTVNEAYSLYEESFNNHGPMFIRLPRSIAKYGKTFVLDENIKFGKWLKIKESQSKNIVIIGVGPYLRELESLVNENNFDCSIFNAIYLNPIDLEALKGISSYKEVVIYDPYSTKNGFATAIMAALLELNFKGDIKVFAIPNEFVKQAKSSEQLESFNLLPQQVFAKIK